VNCWLNLRKIDLAKTLFQIFSDHFVKKLDVKLFNVIKLSVKKSKNFTDFWWWNGL